MRARRLPPNLLERPVPPLSPELAEIVQRQPEEVCRALSPLMSDERMERIEGVLDARVRSVVLVLDRLHDPHNGAAILRTSEALGLMEVHSIQSDERWDLSRRVTQGCHKWLDIVVSQETDACAHALKHRGYTLLAASEKASDSDFELSPDTPVALCLGNENLGITQELLKHCRRVVGIPMLGFTQSLNVSVAAAVMISRLLEGRSRGLENEEREQVRARYYAQSVKEAFGVLRARGVQNR